MLKREERHRRSIGKKKRLVVSCGEESSAQVSKSMHGDWRQSVPLGHHQYHMRCPLRFHATSSDGYIFLRATWRCSQPARRLFQASLPTAANSRDRRAAVVWGRVERGSVCGPCVLGGEMQFGEGRVQVVFPSAACTFLF